MAKLLDPDILFKIRSFRTFDSLSDSNKKYLSEHCLLKPYKKGEILWRKLDPGDFCIVIMDGLTEIVNLNKDGDDSIVGIFGPGDIIGLSAVLKRNPYPSMARVASRSANLLKLYIRSIDQELSDLEKNNMLSWQREKLLIHEQFLRDKITILSSGKLTTRIIELFNHLRFRFSRTHEENPKSILIPIPMTKTLIARIIGARIETVIRILNKWEKGGYLIVDDKGLTLLNFERLKENEGVS